MTTTVQPTNPAGRAARKPTRFTRRRLTSLGGALLGVVLLWIFPYVAPNDSALLTFSTIFMWVTLASSWNLISGFTGYVDLGHGVHFGIGGYVTGILMTRYDLGFWTTVPVAAVVCAAFAALIGWPLLRLRGVYFSIAVLGAFLSLRQFSFLAEPLTGGARGLVIPAIVNRYFFYYVFLAIAIVVVAGTFWLRRTQYGASLMAIRDDEEGAEARGINTTALKLSIFVVSAAITGVAGTLWAYQATFIDPNIMFREDFVITLAVMATLGGLGSTWGPAVGAAVYLVLQDFLWASEGSGSFLIYFGAVLVLLVLFLPEGIAGAITRGERSAVGRQILRFRRRWFGMTDHRAYGDVPSPDADQKEQP